MSQNRIITDILSDLKHNNITEELVNELITVFETDISDYENDIISEEELYEMIISYLPELR